MPLHSLAFLQVGISNTRQSCYLNATLVCFSALCYHIPALLEELPHLLASVIQRLLSSTVPSHAPINLEDDAVCREMCSSWPLGTQEDACEFMQHITPTYTRSLLVRVAHSSVHSSGRRTLNVQESFFVSVHIGDAPPDSTLQSLFDRKFGSTDSRDRLDSAEEWRHAQHLASTSSGLIIHLARFSYDRVNSRAQKVRTKLGIGLQLAIPCSPLQDSGQIELVGEVDRRRYSLTSVVCHHGDSIQNGHYTAYILLGATGGDRVAHFDDQRPFPASTCTVDNLDELIQKDAFLLFFRLS